MGGNARRIPRFQVRFQSPARPAYREQVSMRGGSQGALFICMSQSRYNGISMLLSWTRNLGNVSLAHPRPRSRYLFSGEVA